MKGRSTMKATSWAAVLVLIPLLAGCAFNTPPTVPGNWNDSDNADMMMADAGELDSLRARVADLEERMTANEDLAEEAMITADKALKCCRKDYTIIMTEEVYFDFNKYDVKPEFHDALDRVANKLKSDPDLICELSGHTDGIGTSDYNIVLGQKRADAARQYLISKHEISLGRMAIRTFGKAAPIAANDSDQGRSKNRRVTVDVLGYSE